MKIIFRQSGGFAGLIRGCELDTDLLSVSEATKLQSLVEQSGILQAKSKSTSEARDLLNYEITVETKERTVHVLFDDLTVPESAAELFNYLLERAKPLPLS